MAKKRLEIVNAIDENLKLVRDADGTDTPLQLSKDKMKVVGDLDVTGNINISNQDDPIIDKNLATKGYVDNNGGSILGYTCLLNDSADTSYGVTTSIATINADAKVEFIAPSSGNVQISVSVFAKWTSTRFLVLGLSDNATYNTVDVTHEHYAGECDETDHKTINHTWVITGLTAGTSYTYWLGAKAEQVGRITLYWGGDAADEYAPFIMKATALPTTIYTG